MADLRFYLREELVKWVKREAPHSLPRTRIEGEFRDVEELRGITDDQALDARPAKPLGGRRSLSPDQHVAPPEETRVLDPGEMFGEPSALYTGSPENERRADKFTGPDEEVQAERDEEAERLATESVFADAYESPGTDSAGTSSARAGITDSPNDGATRSIPVTRGRTDDEPAEGEENRSR